jgi:hypothetical protein
VATFRRAEVPPVFPIHFENLGAPDEDLLRVLRQRDPLFSAAKGSFRNNCANRSLTVAAPLRFQRLATNEQVIS